MTITRYRTGSGTIVRTDVERWDAASCPATKSPRPAGDPETMVGTGYETQLPSERFFAKYRSCNRYSIENHSTDEFDAENLAGDLAVAIHFDDYKNHKHRGLITHPYVTKEYKTGGFGEILPLDCPHDVAARRDHEVFQLINDASCRGKYMTKAQHDAFIKSVRDVPDDLEPLYDTIGRTFMPLRYERLVGVGKPYKRYGYVLNWSTKCWERTYTICYKSYRKVYECPWAKELGIDFKDCEPTKTNRKEKKDA